MKSIIKKVIVFVVILSFFASNTTYGAAGILHNKDTLRTPALANSIMPTGNTEGIAELIVSLKIEEPSRFLKPSLSGNIVDIVNMQYKREHTNRDGKAWKAYDRLGTLLNQFMEGEIPYSSIRQYLQDYPKNERLTKYIMPTLIRLGSVNGDAYLGLEKKGLAGDYKLIFVGAGSYCPMPGLELVEIAALIEAAGIRDTQEKKIWEEFLAQIQEKMGHISTSVFSKSDIGSEDYTQQMSEIFNYIFASDGMYYMKELSSDVKLFFSENVFCAVTGSVIKKFSRLTGEELSFAQPRDIDSVEVDSIGELLKYVFIPENTHIYKYLKKNIKKETRVLAPFGSGYFYFAKINGTFKMYNMKEEEEEYAFLSKIDVFDFAKRGNNVYIAGTDGNSPVHKELNVRTGWVTDIIDFKKAPFLSIFKTGYEIIIMKHNAEEDLETRHYNLKKPLLKRYLPFLKSSSAGRIMFSKDLAESSAAMPDKKSIKDIDITGKDILMRVDFNVPLDDKQNITDDSRIRAAVPTIKYILDKNAKLILMSHLGRPKGRVNHELSLKPVAKRLSEILDKPVAMLNDCIGDEVKSVVSKMADGDVVMLENLRFYKQEIKNEESFAKELASLGDLFVNNAFGTAHRAHASTEGVTHYLESVSGFLMEKEIDYFQKILTKPDKPFMLLLGGAKIAGKIPVIKNMMDKVDTIIIAGAMAYTFMKVKGVEIGSSCYKADMEDTVKIIFDKARDKGVDIILPIDHIVTDSIEEPAIIKTTPGERIEEGFIGADIGPKTIDLFIDKIKEAKTIVWNGPAGAFENDEFANGTKALAEAIAVSTAISVIGGGDIVAAAAKFGVLDKISHISSGGGAFLEYLAGKKLPGIHSLSDREKIAKSLEGHAKASSAGGWNTEDIVEINPVSQLFFQFASEKDPDALKVLINIAEKFTEDPDINPEKREVLSHVILSAKMRLLCQFPPASVKERKTLVYKLKELEKQWQKALEGLSQKASRVSRFQFADKYKALQYRLTAYKGILTTLRWDIEKLEANLPQPFTYHLSIKTSSAGVSLTDRDIEHINLAAEIANLTDATGTIAYNDTVLSLKQQQMMQSLIGTGTSGLAKLEARLGCSVKLMSQGNIKDNADTIIISNERLSDFKNAKYFITEQVQIDTSYVAVAPLIAIAKGLLGLESETEQPKLYMALKSSIRSLSHGLLNERDIEAAITAYINGNPMFIKLPPAITYDYDQLEQLQRQAFMVLIAA
jgi:phosphoglycerate kinase